MSVYYGPVFKLFLLKDPGTGERRQLSDEAKAARLAREICERTGRPLKEVLIPSRHFYVLEYVSKGQRGRRINTWDQDEQVDQNQHPRGAHQGGAGLMKTYG